MAQFMIQVAYTPEAWATLVRNPQNRIEMVRPAVEGAGGRLEGAWFAFGEYDIVVIATFPDAVSAAALAVSFAAGGALRAVKTTTLLSAEEGVEVMRRAGSLGYKPPSG